MFSRRTRLKWLIGVAVVGCVVFLIWQQFRVSLDTPLARTASQVVYITFGNTGASTNANAYVLDTETGTVTQMTTNHRIARSGWSADGESLVLFFGEGKSSELLANGEIRALADDPYSQKNFSPDGTYFSYDNCPYDTGSTYGLRDDSSSFIVETANRANTREVKKACFAGWSPESNQIAFMFQQSDDADPEIYIENVDGSNRHRLVANVGADGKPQWSPAGDRIAFSSMVQSDDPNFSNLYLESLYVVDATGENLTKVGLLERVAIYDWSTDGQMLLYISEGMLCFIKEDASTPNCPIGNVFGAAWSSDGKQAVYRKGRGPLCITDPLAAVIVEKRCFPGTEEAMFMEWRPLP